MKNGRSPAKLRLVSSCAAAILGLAGAGCRRGMVDQQYRRPLAEEDFFADQRASRVPPSHTVARGNLREDEAFYTGKIGDQLVATFPMKVTPELLARGQERFNIYCSECHGRTGEGNGMIVQRGFPRPPSFHQDRLRQAPVGHFFHVITNGYGAMFPYASRVEPADRWAVAAYIRALQLSQNAAITDADPEGAKELGGEGSRRTPSSNQMRTPLENQNGSAGASPSRTTPAVSPISGAGEKANSP